MNWNKVSNEFPEGQVLGLCWIPMFGDMHPEVRVVYYDNPKDYTEGGEGWLTWAGDLPAYVSHWMPLPELPNDIPTRIDQKEFQNMKRVDNSIMVIKV